MRLGWQEIRQRARGFSQRWHDAKYEKGETQTFYNEFFQIFGIDRKKVAIFERKIEMIDANRRGFIDLFWPSVLLVEQKSAGKSLFKAQDQALDYVLGLKDRDIPRFVLACDFQRFRLLELETRREVEFTLPQLHKHVEEFAFMLGVERRHYGKQAAVNIKAAELLGKVRDGLEAKGYKGVDLERLMVRLLFCLFADDTGIFESKDDFLYLIEDRTDEDGNNVGRVLNELFEILDTPDDERLEGADPEFNKFPYVNGDLFKGHLRTANFDTEIRDDLLTACKFDWGKVSPAVFGSLFQSVMDAEERRKKGAHYTTEPNIMKVIGPLFLDELRAELDHLKSRRDGGKRKALLEYQHKLGKLNFFDPACGCGNFLVVTYRELRKLEQEALEQVYDPNSPMMLEVEALSVVSLDQFYGIELEEFPAHIAEVAMWMSEHLANIELGRTYGKVFADIPLSDSATIVHGDALETQWQDVLPAEQCFVLMGNPPFIGKSDQSEVQRQQLADIVDRAGARSSSLDFVCAWFLSAGSYIDNGPVKVGFVATNSITQGEQVSQLWPLLFKRYGLEIAFAHRTFAWGSDARGKAHVHVVIIGLTHRDYEPREKRLFSYDNIKGEPDESIESGISPYLISSSNMSDRHRFVSEVRTPLSDVPKIIYGSKPVDGGNLILSSSERQTLVTQHPSSQKWIKPLIGAQEFLHGGDRWCLWLVDASPSDLKAHPFILERVKAVAAFRRASKKIPTQKAAEKPSFFAEIRQPDSDYIVIPMHTSEDRIYVPFGFYKSDSIVHNSCTCIPDGGLFTFGIISSLMHMEWLRHIGGRLESRYRYANTLVYNTFPWPEASDAQRKNIETLAQAVLDAREEWPTSSLADLYDPDTMPANLRKAHKALDKAVDRLYRKKPFDSDRDRVEHLFELYEKLVDPLSDAEKQNKRVARNVKRRRKS